MGQVVSKTEADSGSKGEQAVQTTYSSNEQQQKAPPKDSRHHRAASGRRMEGGGNIGNGTATANGGGGVKSERAAAAATTPKPSVSSTTCKENKLGDNHRRRHPRSRNNRNVVVDSDNPGTSVPMGNQELMTARSGNGMRPPIFLAPPEKWLENGGDDHDMEDGEICSDEEGGGLSNNLPWSGKSDLIDKRWPPPDGQEKVLKRRKLEVTTSHHESTNNLNPGLLQSCKLEGHENGGGGGAPFNYDSSAESSSDPSNNEDQFLVPLFREVIDAERKKKAELEEDNRRLKSLLARVSVEKEETFQLLRQSNKKLAEVTDASVVLEKSVEELNAQLAEKNALIKTLKKETFVIRGVISRMNKTFDELQSKDNAAQMEKGQAEKRAAIPSLLPGLKGNYRQRSDRDELKDSKPAHGILAAEVNNNSAPPSSNNDHRQEIKEQNKPPSSSKPSAATEEEFILTKLKDLRKWAYTVKDIKRVDGRWRCPECGDSKFTLLATAAHARDKHVWKLGAGLPPRVR